MMISPIITHVFDRDSAEEEGLGHILRAVRTHLGMDVGFISEFHDGRRVFRHVEAEAGEPCISVGASDPLEESYCHWIAQGKLPRLIRDPHDHPFTARFPATNALPVGAHLSVPIKLRDGQIYGTFCCFSFAPDQSLTERDLATMEAFAHVASELIQGSIDNDRTRQIKLTKIQDVLRSGDLQMVYQPAIRLASGHPEFVEALARFRSKPYQAPDRWFAIAAEVNLAAELEIVAVQIALQGLAELPSATSLSINVSPDVIIGEAFNAVVQSAPLDRIILEITEHETVTNYGALVRALAPFRTRGLKIAVDDAGAGHSSLRHILKLKPDLIKLDMSLIQKIDRDPGRHALAAALIAFSREIGSELVAEGVETEGELGALRKLGVDIAQGYLLSRPLPASQLNAFLGGCPPVAPLTAAQ